MEMFFGIIGCIGLVVGIVGIVVSIVMGTRKKEFTYVKTSNRIINMGVSSINNNLKLLFNDEPISDLTVTRIIIWNSGREEISSDNDLYKDKQLKIIGNESTVILDAASIKDSDPKGKFTCSLTNKDGVAIQVLHSGSADELKLDKDDIIKGGKIRNYELTFTESFIESKKTSLTLLFIILSIISIVSLVSFIFILLCLFHVFDYPLSPSFFLLIDISELNIINLLGSLLMWGAIFALFFSFVFSFIKDNLSIPAQLKKYAVIEFSS